jgi:hypothetical protein
MMSELPVSFIEEMVFYPPEGMENYRAYRIEYGGHAEACVMSGSIWLPPGVDPREIKNILNGGSYESRD